MDEAQIAFDTATTNGVSLNVARLGQPGEKTIVLLHGFPEFWRGWLKLMPLLAAAGWTVLAPDQRGYNRSGKPAGLSAYRLDCLSGDIAGLLDFYGLENAVVAGHDWGGAVAWTLALDQPRRVRKLLILNSAPGWVLQQTVMRDPRQGIKSLYMLGFQLPALPEALWAANNFHRGVDSLLKSSRPGAFSQDDLSALRAAWSQPGAQTAMLNWYRAAFRRPYQSAARRTDIPLLVVWGYRDAFLTPGLAEKNAAVSSNAQLVMLPEATHWLHHEQPEVVARAMLDFIA